LDILSREVTNSGYFIHYAGFGPIDGYKKYYTMMALAGSTQFQFFYSIMMGGIVNSMVLPGKLNLPESAGQRSGQT
jgi:hypothetical protein